MSEKFEQWLAEVDRICIRLCGIDRDSFPDWHWRDSFDSGWTPREAFDGIYEDQFGESWAAQNSQFGMGA